MAQNAESTSEAGTIRMPECWKSRLSEEFVKPYMKKLRAFLQEEYQARKMIYPAKSEYFAAFDLTPFADVKVVILGQDPYHGMGQAHGLCFSVKPGVHLPPSLQNIYQEMSTDLGIRQPPTGYLVPWATQGVLLLNATLTVEQGQAGSHQKKGWEEFTDRVIHVLNEQRQNIVYMLWGAYAQKKGAFISRENNLVLEAPHPSPLSAHRGFFGCRHFSRANGYLIETGQTPIEWQLPQVANTSM